MAAILSSQTANVCKLKGHAIFGRSCHICICFIRSVHYRKIRRYKPSALHRGVVSKLEVHSVGPSKRYNTSLASCASKTYINIPDARREISKLLYFFSVTGRNKTDCCWIAGEMCWSGVHDLDEIMPNEPKCDVERERGQEWTVDIESALFALDS